MTLSTVLYGIIAAAFIAAGAMALARPELILAIRAKLRPLQNADLMKARRRAFGAREVRICGVALLIIGAALSAHAEDWSPWQRAYDPETRTRFIPVELWTGAQWDGAQEIRMAPAALDFGRRAEKSIKGPTNWNGIQVYERTNRDKVQLFAIREDRTGLGRVYDSRNPRAGCTGEVKFPLGRWKQGEVREYQLDCARGKRPLKVTIEEIDFVHDGVPHSLRFHWLLMGGQGRGTDMRYVYSPLRGLVQVQGNE